LQRRLAPDTAIGPSVDQTLCRGDAPRTSEQHTLFASDDVEQRGDMLGPDQPVILQLLEITPALPALQGVVMELKDCAFPTLHGVIATDDPNVAFKDVDYALLVGARPRGAGMERKDLLEANGAIFAPQGKALNASANGAPASRARRRTDSSTKNSPWGVGVADLPTIALTVLAFRPLR